MVQKDVVKEEVAIVPFDRKAMKRARSKANSSLRDLEQLPENTSQTVVKWFADVARADLKKVFELIEEAERLA